MAVVHHALDRCLGAHLSARPGILCALVAKHCGLQAPPSNGGKGTARACGLPAVMPWARGGRSHPVGYRLMRLRTEGIDVLSDHAIQLLVVLADQHTATRAGYSAHHGSQSFLVRFAREDVRQPGPLRSPTLIRPPSIYRVREAPQWTDRPDPRHPICAECPWVRRAKRRCIGSNLTVLPGSADS